MDRAAQNGGDMKNTFMMFAIMTGALLTTAHAAAKAEFQPATVVSVESRSIPFTYAGDNPSDAPFQSEIFSYDIGILVGSTVYRTSYDSAVDGLPSAFAPHHSVRVNLKKHVMEVELPGDHTVRLAIESRTSAKPVGAQPAL